MKEKILVTSILIALALLWYALTGVIILYLKPISFTWDNYLITILNLGSFLAYWLGIEFVFGISTLFDFIFKKYFNHG